MNSTPPRPAAPGRAGRLFLLTAVGAGAFIVTTFAVTALAFGSGESPAARWFEANAIAILAAEVVFTLTVGVLAMAADRRETLRRLHDEMTARLAARQPDANPGPDSSPSDAPRA